MLGILAFWYQVIIASEPLLFDSIAMLGDDGFDGELKSFYTKHLEDEKNHAKWLEEDLGDFPIKLNMNAAILAGTQYYLIRHVHPVCLLGYMQALEGGKIDPAFIEKLEQEHGKKSARTLKIHADNDPGHFKELMEFPVPDDLAPLVEASRTQTLKHLESLYGN